MSVGKQFTPAELRAHEFVHAIAFLVGDRTARVSHLFDYVGQGEALARDPHLVLPIREVEGDERTAGAHFGMIVRPERMKSREARELYAFFWYLRVREENGAQGVWTPKGIFFRKELEDGAAVLSYLRRRLRPTLRESAIRTRSAARGMPKVERVLEGGQAVPEHGAHDLIVAMVEELARALLRTRKEGLRAAMLEAIARLRDLAGEPDDGSLADRIADVFLGAFDRFEDPDERKEAVRQVRDKITPGMGRRIAG